MKALKITGFVIGGISLFALTAFVVSLILSSLWNWLMPEIVNLPEIGLWQAAGLFILSKLLFTPGMGKSKNSHSSSRSKAWKRKFTKRMTDSSKYSHYTDCCSEPEAEPEGNKPEKKD